MVEPLNIRCARRAAEALGYAHEIVDPFSHYLIKLSSGDRFAFVGAGGVHGFPLNDATVATIAKDKSHSYELLRRIGVRVPASQLVFVDQRYADLRPAGREVADAKAFAAQIGYPVFVKPNDGSRGALAQSVANEAELEAHLGKIAATSVSAVVQQYLRGSERRIFYIDGVPLFAYAKTKPALCGDGERTVAALLREVDARYVRSGLSPVNMRDAVLQQALAARGLRLDSVAPAGLAIPFSEKANVSGGGGVAGFRETFTPFEAALCRAIRDDIGLRVCAIDLLIEDDAPEEEAYVLELNANPALASLEKLGKDDLLMRIWTEVLRKAVEG